MRQYIGFLLLALSATFVRAADALPYPAPVEGDYTIKDFKFASGETLPALRMHYRTFGKPQRDAQGNINNAVLIMHGTNGSSAQFLRTDFANVLFVPGGVLDAQRYYIIAVDGIGHGKSSKPSDGLHAHFPHYGYNDMVEADYKLLVDGLGVKHARLVMGTSMGGMHSWLWGERYPDFMDALMPLASLPTQIAARNRVWRRTVIDAIRNDPEWKGGEYTKQPPSMRVAAQLLYLVGSNPVLRQGETPTLAGTDTAMEENVATVMRTNDANDMLYALEASRDYDPGPGLEKIKAHMLAWNSYDDLINPGELGILEREIKRVAKGQAVVAPWSADLRGHGSHTYANLWKTHLQQLLERSAK